jgi:dihydroorotase
MTVAYDLLLTGAHVVDVGAGRVGRYDVAVRAGRIAAVADRLDGDARVTVDLTGRVLTPGLVDLHTHVFPGATYWGIDPDPVAWYSGVTTWIDAGSAGAYTLDALAAAARGNQVRVRALLNISAVGLAGRTGESVDLDNCDVDMAITATAAHRELVVGVKVRMDRFTTGTNGLEPLRRAITVAEACELPVMVHVGYAPPAVRDLLPLLRPGDVVTHCASGCTSGVARAGVLDPALKEAYDAGVVFDIGHGSGGFAFDVLETQLAGGLVPQTVSTDLHARSLYGPAFDLPTTMNKMLAVGLPLDDVVAAATVRPADVLHLDSGTLRVGAPADFAVFRVDEGEFVWSDVHGGRRTGHRRLVDEATYVAGVPLPPRLPAPPPPWVPLTDAQRAALHERERAVRALLTTPLVDPEGMADQFPRPAEEDC